MSVTNRLIFDAGTDGSNVGSWVRSGVDGSRIASQLIAAEEWLNVASALHAGDGTAITQTGGALDINIASGSLTTTEADNYAEDSAHASGNTGGFVLGVRVDSLAAVPATALAGTELDYQAFISGPNGELLIGAVQLDIDDLNAVNDAVQAWAFDGIGNAIGSTAGSLDVNVTNNIDLDDDLANIAIENTSTAVSLIAVNVVAASLAARKHMFLANEGNKTLYFGKTGVTTANGFPMHRGEKMEVRVGPLVSPQVIGSTGSSAEDLRVMELS